MQELQKYAEMELLSRFSLNSGPVRLFFFFIFILEIAHLILVELGDINKNNTSVHTKKKSCYIRLHLSLISAHVFN